MRQMSYQPIGDLTLDLPGRAVTNYRRELDLDPRPLRVTYRVGGIRSCASSS